MTDPVPPQDPASSAPHAHSGLPDGLISATQPQPETSHTTKPEYVVAIGASAGGLDALEKLFSPLPADSGAAFVVIQHLSPDHKSMMDSLLARHTSMPVVTITNGMEIQANHVYLIPPGSMMHLDGLHFRLTPKHPRALNLPIDVFFQSLASQFKEKSVAVVLSGTGSDGTRGAGAINEAGGVLIAQEPESAKFDGMPRSVISTGLVDAILPVEQMADRIAAHVGAASSAVSMRDPHKVTATDQGQEAMSGILHLLQQAGGINFEDYKPGTVTRRIERRMAVRQIESLQDYLAILNEDRAELLTLRRELLIPVTSFFRDTEAFETIKHHVVDAILSRKETGEGIRVWCAGVSTGEEAYSIAMLFLEAFDQAKRWPALKIFATDVEQLNIDTASAGIYPESIMAEVSSEQLERFFTKRGTQYVVKNELRQCIVFARHNLLSDPPFTKMDLVSCRNVLIYFRNDAQQRVLRRLQYALAPNSFLFLGSSESLGPLQSDFQTISARQKVWKKLRPSLLPLEIENRMSNAHSAHIAPRKRSEPLAAQHSQTVVQRGYNTLLRAFAPPAAILVGPHQELIHSYGDVSRYLSLREGQASLEISRILPKQLVPVAAALLFKSARESTSASSDIVYLQADEFDPNSGERMPRRGVRLSAWPVGSDNEFHETLLVFEEVLPPSPPSTTATVDVQQETSERMEVLQHELAATRESLQATIEELETSNEELQATNEEMMASNEELQSSNEELQSVNEELNTVNAEYQEKIEILNRVNADLDNLARVVASGTVFVDDKLQLTRFSPDAPHIFKLRSSDIGRPLSDLSHVLHYPNLMRDLQQALDSGQMTEKDVNGPEGRRYLVKMLPYRIPSSAGRGLVISFIDMTSVRRATHLQSILDAAPGYTAVLDDHGAVALISKAWSAAIEQQGKPVLAMKTGQGENYLDACFFNKSADDGQWCAAAAEGLRDLLLGKTQEIQLSYNQAIGERQQAFILYARKLESPDFGIFIQHLQQ